MPITGRIVRGHVAIITEPSPHYVITESTISGRDVVLLPGLLLIFLHGCEIKSGWGLGTRLALSDSEVSTISKADSSERRRSPKLLIRDARSHNFCNVNDVII